MITSVRNNMLLVNKGRFYWDNEVGLMTSNRENGTAALQSLTGENLSGFLDEVKSGKVKYQRDGAASGSSGKRDVR